MRVVDDAVLTRARTSGVTIYDGLVEVDNSTNVVSYPTPYAVFYSSIGDDDNRRLNGRDARRSVYFTVIYVGLDRNQAKWAGEKIRERLQYHRPVVTGWRSWPIQLQESQRVRRDDDAVRPDGSPLFYGVDNFAASVTRTY